MENDFDKFFERVQPKTLVYTELFKEVAKLRKFDENTASWKITGLTNAMGPPWDNCKYKTVSDFITDLFIKCEVREIGIETLTVAHSECDDNNPHSATKEGTFIKIDIMPTLEHKITVSLLEEKRESKATCKLVTITHDVMDSSPLIVDTSIRFNRTTEAKIDYGTYQWDKSVEISLNAKTYTLTGVVCRRDDYSMTGVVSHYTSFVWFKSKWWFYNDVAGYLIPHTDPETHDDYKPSKYGQVFFYKPTKRRDPIIDVWTAPALRNNTKFANLRKRYNLGANNIKTRLHDLHVELCNNVNTKEECTALNDKLGNVLVNGG